MDHGVGGGQVQPQPTGLEAGQQHRHLPRLEPGHHVAALRGWGLAGECEVRHPQPLQRRANQAQHFGELRKHQHPVPAGHQRGQHLAQQRKFGALHGGGGVQPFHQVRVTTDLAQLQQRAQHTDLRTRQAVFDQHTAHQVVGAHPHTFVQRALLACQGHTADNFGDGWQLGRHVFLAAAQDKRAHAPGQRLGAQGFAVHLDRFAPVALEAAHITQKPGHQKVELRPQLTQVVLQRCAGQRQAVPGAQAAHGAGRTAGGVFHTLRFVQHQHMERLRGQRTDVAPQQRKGRQHQVGLRHRREVVGTVRAV